MTRDQAVTFLEARGVSAKQRRWAMGDTIEVPLGSPTIQAGITIYPDVVWLLEDGVPPCWYLVRIIMQRESRAEFESLEAACNEALELSRRAERTT
jgi:hypothetical protein